MVPQTENGLVTNWKLVNQEGYELGTIHIFLSDSSQYLRKFLFFYARSARALKAGKQWVKDKVENGGVWVMYHSDFQNDRVALVAIFGNLGISFRETGSNDQLRFDSKDVQELFQLLLGEKKYEAPGDDLKVALGKDKQRDMVREKEREKEQRKRDEEEKLEKWKKDPCYGMPSLCDEAIAYDSSRAPVELLKHGESLSEELTIPNAHEGRITLDLVKKWGGKSFRVEGVGHLRNGVHAELKPCGKLEEAMERGARVEILVAHARSRKEAMELLLRLRFYDPRNTKRDPRDVAAATVVKPGKVGDFDLGCGPVLGPDGALVKGSEQSAVYFLRGNTVVMVLSTDPGYPVLGMARKLDAALEGKGSKTAAKTD